MAAPRLTEKQAAVCGKLKNKPPFAEKRSSTPA
jgi:hypothetical protein